MTKAVKIEKLKALANELLALEGVTPEFRNGVATLIGYILIEANAYKGFNYLGWVTKGHQEWLNAGSEPLEVKKFIGDESRKVFY
jgi:hypothetical protein